MQINEKALKPCPFCGKGMILRGALWPSEGDRDAIIHAEPTDCPLPQFSNDTFDESIVEVLNRRSLTSATPPDVAGLIQRLEGYVECCPPGFEKQHHADMIRAVTALRLSAGGGASHAARDVIAKALQGWFDKNGFLSYENAADIAVYSLTSAGYVILSPDEVSQIAELKAELDLLQDILDSRPAINAALPDSYIRWSQAIYSGDAIRSLKGGRDAQ